MIKGRLIRNVFVDNINLAPSGISGVNYFEDPF